MERFIMQPGPTQIDPRVVQATMRPVTHHTDPAFVADFDRTCELLRPMFGIGDDGEVMIAPVSGRGGLEAVATTLTDGVRPVLVIHTGVFSGMFMDVMASLCVPFVSVEAMPGVDLDLAVVAAAITEHEPFMVSIVHTETGTGLEVGRGVLAALASLAHEHGCLFMVDAVAAFGAVPLEMEALRIDVAVAGSQKAIGAQTGLAMIAFSPRAIAVMQARPEGVARSYFLDLARWWRTWLPRERGGEQRAGARVMCWSMNTYGVYALLRACELAYEEGLAARYDRHLRVSRAFQAACAHLGFGFLDRHELLSRTVTVVTLPEGVTAAEILDVLLTKYGLAASVGLGADWGGRTVRFGHMAETARERPVAFAVAALGDALRRFGVAHPADALEVFWNEIESVEPADLPAAPAE